MKIQSCFSIAVAVVSVFIGVSYSPVFANVTRDEPVKTETSSDGKVTTSTYADGTKTNYNKETGVYELADSSAWTTSSSSSSSSGGAAAGAAGAAGGGGAAGTSGAAWEKKAEEGGGSFVYVTEKIPGANCTSVRWNTQTTRLYRCPVGSGFDTVVGVLGSLIKYATYLTGLIGVLMIVLSGIQYSLSGGGEDAKKAKGRIIQLITGLVLLFLTGLILNTVAPWVYR